MAKTMRELYRLYGDLPADKAHAFMKADPTVKAVPKRDDVRSAWRDFRASADAPVPTVFETSCGRRFLSRQGRYRFCERTGAKPIRAMGEEE